MKTTDKSGSTSTTAPIEKASTVNVWRTMPGGIWALGFVSMLMDISSEMIHALLPLYMVTVLGTSVLAVGLIEGIAEATASITKVFSGALSDRLGKRKLLAALGYGLGALSKPSGVYFPSRRHPVNQGRSEVVAFTSLMTTVFQLHDSLSGTTQPSSLRERQVRDGPWPWSQEFELRGVAR